MESDLAFPCYSLAIKYEFYLITGYPLRDFKDKQILSPYRAKQIQSIT